jgi:hypothetical protein
MAKACKTGDNPWFHRLKSGKAGRRYHWPSSPPRKGKLGSTGVLRGRQDGSGVGAEGQYARERSGSIVRLLYRNSLSFRRAVALSQHPSAELGATHENGIAVLEVCSTCRTSRGQSRRQIRRSIGTCPRRLQDAWSGRIAMHSVQRSIPAAATPLVKTCGSPAVCLPRSLGILRGAETEVHSLQENATIVIRNLGHAP